MKTQVPPSRSFARRFKASGMTLIEISLVIALLLGLISVVFLGIGSYRKGADKARCKMQLAAVQKAARSHANFNNLNIGEALVKADLIGVGLAMENEPACPSDSSIAYTFGTVVPAVGTPYATCPNAGPPSHDILADVDVKDW